MFLQEALNSFQNQLQKAGVDNPVLDTRLLVAHALGCDRVSLIANPERVLTDEEHAAIATLIERRAQREPVARILGAREFWGLPFGLNEATLEPRPDSETLIEAALQCARERGAPQTILDLGTGTGCLLLSLLHEWPHAFGLGIDQSDRALEQATINAETLDLADRVRFQKGNWLDGIDARFDLIVSNPPYIPDADIEWLEPEVKNHDPMAALGGGADGLEPYRLIIPSLTAHLNDGGAVFFEVGMHQAPNVATLLEKAGLTDITTTRDLGGVERIVGARI